MPPCPHCARRCAVLHRDERRIWPHADRRDARHPRSGTRRRQRTPLAELRLVEKSRAARRRCPRAKAVEDAIAQGGMRGRRGRRRHRCAWDRAGDDSAAAARSRCLPRGTFNYFSRHDHGIRPVSKHRPGSCCTRAVSGAGQVVNGRMFLVNAPRPRPLSEAARRPRGAWTSGSSAAAARSRCGRRRSAKLLQGSPPLAPPYRARRQHARDPPIHALRRQQPAGQPRADRHEGRRRCWNRACWSPSRRARSGRSRRSCCRCAARRAG